MALITSLKTQAEKPKLYAPCWLSSIEYVRDGQYAGKDVGVFRFIYTTFGLRGDTQVMTMIKADAPSQLLANLETLRNTAAEFYGQQGRCRWALTASVGSMV